MIKQVLKIKGMHCASCATIISKKVGALSGVSNIDVNVATENVNIEFDPEKISIEKMNDEIIKLGYSFVDNDKTSEGHSKHTGMGQSKDEKQKGSC